MSAHAQFAGNSTSHLRRCSDIVCKWVAWEEWPAGDLAPVTVVADVGSLQPRLQALGATPCFQMPGSGGARWFSDSSDRNRYPAAGSHQTVPLGLVRPGLARHQPLPALCQWGEGQCDGPLALQQSRAICGISRAAAAAIAFFAVSRLVYSVALRRVTVQGG